VKLQTGIDGMIDEAAPSKSITAVAEPGPLADGPGLRQEALRGVRNMGLATYGARAVSVVSLIVVARYLSPHDVGLAALALLIGTTLSSLSDFGLAPTIVSFGGEASRATITRAARYRLTFSVSGFLTVFVGAETIANVLGAPEAAQAIRVVSCSLPIAAAGFAPATSLAARRRFGALARAYAVMVVVQAAVTIVLAILGFTYWAVVIGFLAGTAAQVASQWVLWTDRTWGGRKEVGRRELLELGGLVTLSWGSLILLFTTDRLLVSAFFGPANLGYYALAVTWGTFAADSLNQVVGTIALPTFAALGADKRAMARAYLASMRLIVFVSAPAAFGLILVAPELLELILGGGTAKWLPALGALQIMALFGFLKSVVGSANGVLLASQNFRRYSYLIPIPIATFILVVFPLLGVQHSIEAVAVALLVAYLVNALLVLRAIAKIFGLAKVELVRNITGPVVAASAMFIALVPLRLVLSVSWASLVVLIVVGTVLYFGVLLIAGPRAQINEFREAIGVLVRRGPKTSKGPKGTG
jgi:lipopolysaccharide exporter